MKRDRLVEVVKEFATLITGLAFGTVIQNFVVINGLNAAKPTHQIAPSEVLFLFALLLLIVRFYHGNMFELNVSGGGTGGSAYEG